MSSGTITSSFLTGWQHRELVTQLAKREVYARYRGSFGGIIWSFLNPLLMLAVYTFVFSFVFKARWGTEVIAGQPSKADFALLLFSGLILHAFFAECITRAPGLVTSNPNFVKKVVFPLEILPLVAIGSAFFHFVISLSVLLLAYLMFYHTLAWTLIFVPIVLLPFIILIAGASWFLASLGVFIRDLNYTIGILMTILLFLSPVFYPLSALPAKIQFLLYLNPLSIIVEQFRAVALLGQLPDFVALGLYLRVAIMIYLCGIVWFNKTRNGFADVL